MPLRLWLPLDGTNENRGISGTVMSGSPNSWGNGRTGKCATFNNNAAQRITSSTTEFNYTVEDFSWCCWINKDSSTLGTDRDMWAFTVGRADAGSRGYGLRVYQRNSGHNTIQVLFGSGQWGLTNIADGSWHHVAFTRKGSAIKVYLDGVLKTSANFTGTLPTYTEGVGVGLGLFFYSGGNIYPLIGSISDFRIYDHTLSVREVYQISRALLVHYPLCAPDNALPNLLTWSNNYTEANPLVHTSKATDGYKYLGNDSLITVTPGKVYYAQLKCDHVPRPAHDGASGANYDKFTFWFYIRKIGTTKNVGGYDSTACFTSGNIFINDPVNNLYVWKWTAPSTAQDITLRTNSYSDGTNSVTLKFWDFKIEEGAYTSYVPSVNQAQYAELGYDSSIVRDATGRGIDLSYSSTSPEYIAGSPRYAAALNFNQQTYAYRDTFGYVLPNTTIAFWFRPISNDNAEHFLFGMFSTWKSNGTGMYHRVNTSVYPLRFKSDAESADTIIEHTYTLNSWQHVAIVYDGTTIKYYVNAALAHSITYGSNGTCTLGNIYLGNSMYSTHPASETDDSAMSDFRLYGTALSATDIKELYATGAAIDNTGIVHAGSFEEIEPKARAEKTTMFYNSTLTESGGTQCAYKSTALVAVNPNKDAWSYVPAVDTNNSCMTGFYFEYIPGIANYRVDLLLTWSGFTDISTTNPDFSGRFQGQCVKLDGSTEWGSEFLSVALTNAANPQALAKASASGTYLYKSIGFTVPSTYKGQYLGLRTNYSNGTGWFKISKVYIYPADEHSDGMASITSTGGIRSRLLEEAEFE